MCGIHVCAYICVGGYVCMCVVWYVHLCGWICGWMCVGVCVYICVGGYVGGCVLVCVCNVHVFVCIRVWHVFPLFYLLDGLVFIQLSI